jgi:hypothetical protein
MRRIHAVMTPALAFVFAATLAALASVDLPALSQDRPASTVPASPPLRTEADARARADANRRARQEQRLKTGAPEELIAEYVKANIGAVPESLGVSPFYQKYTDAWTFR